MLSKQLNNYGNEMSPLPVLPAWVFINNGSGSESGDCIIYLERIVNPYGFTGIEQGYIADAVNDLGGTPIVVPRITFKDRRRRHYGLSHHSITVLGKIMKTRSYIALPEFSIGHERIIQKQLEENDLLQRHNILRVETDILEEALEHYKLGVKTMGRGPTDDPEFFNTCSAAAIHANSLL